MTSQANNIHPGKKWYGLALLIFLLGPMLGIFLVTHAIIMASKHSVTFYIPGNSNLQIMEPGRYTLWMENKHPNAVATVTDDLQNMTLSFIDNVTQKKVTIKPEMGWKSNDSKNIDHYSLGSINFGHPGTYQMVTTSQHYTPYKVYLRQPSLFTIIRTLALSFLLAIIGMVSGILLAIIILIKRTRASNNMEQQPTSSPSKPETISNEATTWAMVCHLSGFAGFLFPLANIIAPLIIWGFKRQAYPYVDEQGMEAINFQISIAIYYILAAILIIAVIGIFLLPLIAAFHIIAMIIASVEAAHAKPFRYPLTLRFLK